MAFLNPVRAVEPLLLSVTSRLRWLPPMLARLILGWVFLWSGWGKLHALDDIIDFFRTLGIPAPQIQAPFVAGVEFVCGALLLVGLFTRLAAVPLVIVMIVAIITAKREDLHSMGDLFGFIEFLYIGLLLYLAVEGPGPLSLDARIRRKS
jgi:putative oxidoreductase